MKNLTLLLPRFHHRAIEERYGNWQSELLLRREAHDARVMRYEPDLTGASAAEMIVTEFVLVVTDPLLVVAPNLVRFLVDSWTDDAFAAIPVTNETTNQHQRVALPDLYLTLRQFEDVAARVAGNDATITWDESDPGLFFCRAESLRDNHQPMVRALSGKRVRIARNAFVHRWASHRGQSRDDLLPHIDSQAKSILEFGCGEGALGAAIKKRQTCRVVGIELDEHAAAIARHHLDEVHSGDVNEIVTKLTTRFDAIVGGDVLEHLEDPWTFLQTLRGIANPDTRLMLSVPNVACWPIVADLLRGRFDYVHLGILCAGHLRFFTRETIVDMLEIAGWTPESIVAQPSFRNAEHDSFFASIEKTAHEAAALEATGYYVIARPSLEPFSRSASR